MEHQLTAPSAAPADGPGTGGADCDVAVIGAGPVGLALAILLAQSGCAVIVLERWPAPYPAPAGGALRP